jgi:hypothetical integral membrane protein (TIGR02206 family)
MPAASFRHFDTSHIAILLLTVVLPLALAWLVRRKRSDRFSQGVSIALAALLTLNFLGYPIYLLFFPAESDGHWLPMQLCDWALMATVVALLRRSIRWFELAYFWGLAATLQAIITPNLDVGFPSVRFVSFFVAHCGIVVSVLYMLLGFGLRPHASSLVRVWLWSQLYLASALVTNALTGANYGFLSHKPTRASLLDFLSDQPVVYVLQLELLAILFYAILYLPFALLDWRDRATASAS